MKAKILVWMLVALIFVSQAYALGIAPGEKEVHYQPGEKETIDMKIINSNHQKVKVVLYAEGPLADRISFQDPILEITPDQEEVRTQYTVHHPDELKEQGIHDIKIVAREIKEESKDAIGASLAVVSTLKLIVPYSGKYVRAKLFVANFQNNQASNFVIEAENLGDEDVVQAQVSVDILGPFNDKILTLTSDKQRINAKGRVLFPIPWTPTLNPGQYNAIATVIYDDKNVKTSGSFSLGEQKIEVDSIDVRNFKLGGIAKFEILLRNNWNTAFDNVHAEIMVVKDGKIYTESKTESVGLNPQEKKIVNGYWDTGTVIPEKYELKIKLYYGGKSEDKSFEVYVSQNEIRTEGVAKVIAAAQKPEEKVMTYVYLLSVLVMMLIIINMYLYFHKPRTAIAVPVGVMPQASGPMINLQPITPITPVSPTASPATGQQTSQMPSQTTQWPNQTTQGTSSSTTQVATQPSITSDDHKAEIEQHLNELQKIQQEIEKKPADLDLKEDNNPPE